MFCLSFKVSFAFGRCGAGVAFLRKKLRKNLLKTSAAIPTTDTQNPLFASPQTHCRELSKSFSGVFFSLAKRIPWSERNTGKRKLAFFCPYFSRTGGEAKASPPKMTQGTAVPRRKVFAELFSKSDPRAAAHRARRRHPTNQNLKHYLLKSLQKSAI